MKKWFLILLLVGCMSNEFYSLDQVTDVSLLKRDSTNNILLYQVPLETLYFSPGLKRIEKDNNVLFFVVRCKIKETCTVDVPSTIEGAKLKANIGPLEEGLEYLLSDGKDASKLF